MRQQLRRDYELSYVKKQAMDRSVYKKDNDEMTDICQEDQPKNKEMNHFLQSI